MKSDKNKQLLTRTFVTVIILLIGWQTINYVTNTYTPALPDYSKIYNDSTLWQNSITSNNNTQWEYRRKITVTNPTDNNQTGTYGLKLPFYSPWFGDKKVFKVDYGIVKLVKEFPNPDSNGAPLLRDQPVVMFGEDASTIMVYFDYEVEANSNATYYLYYKQSKDVDPKTYDGVKVGIASLGGFIVDSSKAGFNSQTGFAHNSLTFTSHSSNGTTPGEYYYYDNLVVDRLNRWPRYYEYSAGGRGGIRTNSSFDAKNKYIRVAGDRYNNLDYIYLGFYNGNAVPGNGSVPNHQFVGIQTVPDNSTNIDNPEYGPAGWVNDFRFWYANGSSTPTWETPYSVPKDTHKVLEWNFKRVNFLYEFFIDNDGNLTFQLSEDGFDHKKIVTKELGHLPWNTTYFQISAYSYYFKFNSLMVTDGDVYDSTQSNGCIIDAGYESQLVYLQTLRSENTLVYVLGIITLCIVLLHLLLRNKMDYIIRIFLLAMLFVVLFFMFRYHPFRYVFGIEDGYFYVGTSESGLELMGNAGEIHSFFYYFMYFAIPIGILLGSLNLAKNKNPAINQKAIQWFSKIGIIFAMILAGLFFIESSLMNISFYFYSIAILIILFNSFKDGKDQGKTSVDENKKARSRALATISFVYFVIKIIIDGYKNWQVVDPFSILNKTSGTQVALGSLAPILLGYGIPLDVINIIGIVFSDYATYLVLGFNFLRQAITSEGSIFGKINAGIWAIYLNIAGDAIHIPFFALDVSLLMVVGYLIGNRYGGLIDLYSGELHNEMIKKNKAKPIPTSTPKPKPEPTPTSTPKPKPEPTPTSTPMPKPVPTPTSTPTPSSTSSTRPEPRFALMPSYENKITEGEVIDLKWKIDNADGMDFLLKENEQLILSGKYDESKLFEFAVKDKPAGKYYYKIMIDTPTQSWSNEIKVIVQSKLAPLSPENAPRTVLPEPPEIPPPTSNPPTFGLMPSNVTKIETGKTHQLKWIVKNANGMRFRLKENGDTVQVGKYNDSQPILYEILKKSPGKYHYEMRIEAPGHVWSNEVDVIVESPKSP